MDELKNIQSTYEKIAASKTNVPILMVGFNRRFSPHVQKMKELLLTSTGPKSFIMTVNAGFLPKDHWTQDIEKGEEESSEKSVTL